MAEALHPRPSEAIEGQRIRLLARSLAQAEEMFTLIERNRTHLQPWMPWEADTQSLTDSQDYIKQTMQWWSKGTTYDFSIYDKRTEQMIGSFGLHSLDWENLSGHFGFWLDEKYQGQGYISEALKLGESMALELGLHRVLLTCDRLNRRSQAVAHRNHYRLEATRVDDGFDRGRLRDTLQFVKLLNPPLDGQVTENLPRGFSIREAEAEEFWPLVRKPLAEIFDQSELILRPKDVLTPSELARLADLRKPFDKQITSYFLLLNDGSLAGWSWGYQDSPESFYMVNSAVLPEHRGRGLYGRLLELAIEKAKAQDFQRIWSRHNIANNTIIAKKLKHGFRITGTELSDVFGSLIHLTYFTNSTRQEVMDFRAGYRPPKGVVKDWLLKK